jgi:hypothetical protein
LLLQVSLRQVLQLTLGEFKLGRACDSQLCAISGDDNIVGGQSSGLSSDLDMIVKVLLEESNIQDLIVDRLSAVEDKLNNILLSLNLDSRTDASISKSVNGYCIRRDESATFQTRPKIPRRRVKRGSIGRTSERPPISRQKTTRVDADDWKGGSSLSSMIAYHFDRLN